VYLPHRFTNWRRRARSLAVKPADSGGFLALLSFAGLSSLWVNPLHVKGKFLGTFEFEINGLRDTNQFINQGVDIIYPVAWPEGAVVQRAAEERCAYVIGVDVDRRKLFTEFRTVILTSVVKNFDDSVIEAIRMVLEGDLGEGIVYGALGNGGVDLAPDVDDDSKIPEWLKDEIAFIRGEIVQGRIITYLE